MTLSDEWRPESCAAITDTYDGELDFGSHQPSNLPINIDGVRNVGKKITATPTRGASMAATGEFRAAEFAHLADKRRVARNDSGAPLGIRIERDGTEPLTITLYPDRTYVFGRSAESSVAFSSDSVSRLHAQLRFFEDTWLLRDLNSRNGCFLATSAATDDDARRGARTIGVHREYKAVVGETVLLGSGKNRLTFLAEVPESELRSTSGSQSPATQRLERAIDVCAKHRLPIFLLGASGTGKTHVARTIHERARTPGHFVLLNCGRLPHDASQLASELLGHVKGSFTGAVGDRVGRLWSADGGTLFLDEVESLPRAAQDFLLDVLEGTGNFSPYGAPHDTKRVPPNFRLISASKAPLTQSGLRHDLCQRLAAGEILSIPTLAQRAADIPMLVDAFLAQLRSAQQLDAVLTEEAMRYLSAASWPGEIRELESTVKVVVSREHASRQLDGLVSGRIVIGVNEVKAYLEQRRAGFGIDVEVKGPPPTVIRKRPVDLTVEDIEAALAAHGGNKTRAAADLGIAVNTLKSRLKGTP